MKIEKKVVMKKMIMKIVKIIIMKYDEDEDMNAEDNMNENDI